MALVKDSGKWITPSEAGEVAGQYRALAEKARSIAHVASQTSSILDESWLGNAKNIFDSHFNSYPSDLLAYADWLEEMAHKISNIEVWVPGKGK